MSVVKWAFSHLLSGMLLTAVLASLVGAEVGTLPMMEHVSGETVFLEGLETWGLKS